MNVNSTLLYYSVFAADVGIDANGCFTASTAADATDAADATRTNSPRADARANARANASTRADASSATWNKGWVEHRNGLAFLLTKMASYGIKVRHLHETLACLRMVLMPVAMAPMGQGGVSGSIKGEVFTKETGEDFFPATPQAVREPKDFLSIPQLFLQIWVFKRFLWNFIKVEIRLKTLHGAQASRDAMLPLWCYVYHSTFWPPGQYPRPTRPKAKDEHGPSHPPRKASHPKKQYALYSHKISQQLVNT